MNMVMDDRVSSIATANKEMQRSEKLDPDGAPEDSSRSPQSSCPRWLVWAAVLLCAVDAVVVVRNFCRYIDTSPYYACDDSLVNVSYALATEGRYGFLSSPFQGGSKSNRNHHFFNYGPWYFYLGAGLFWLFGYSLELMRSIHLLGLLAICGISFCVFRGRVGKLAACLLTVMLLSCFEQVQWPMVRPDIMVSVLAVGFIAAAAAAYNNPRGGWWFAAGLCAGCGAFTHLIAWSLVPVSGAVLFASEWMEPDFPSRLAVWRLLRHAACLAAGGIAAGLMFLASFDFHLEDFLALVSNYDGFLKTQSPSYIVVWRTFTSMAFSYLKNPQAIALKIALVAVLAVVIRLLIGKRLKSRAALGLLWPPLAVLSGYWLSLGSYPNYHGGYVLFLQTTSLWTAAAGVYWFLSQAMENRPRLRTLTAAACVGLIGYVVVPSSQAGLTRSAHRLEKLDQWVAISDYRREILRQLPRGATAIGANMLGDENPGRLQLIVHGMRVMDIKKIQNDTGGRLLPDFLLWSCYEQNAIMINLIARADPNYGRVVPTKEINRYDFVSLEDLQASVRGDDYRLSGLVIASPYGATRIYERFPRGAENVERTPSVSLYDPQRKQWLNRLEASNPVEFRTTSPSVLRNGPAPNVRQRAALQTFVADIADDAYLLTVRLKEPAAGWLCCHGGVEINDTLGELETSFDSCEVTPDERTYYLYHRYSAGQIYLSYFGNADTEVTIAAASVSKITGLGSAWGKGSLVSQPLPDWKEWQVDQPTSVAWAERSPERVVVQGNETAFGYQVAGPMLELPPHAEATLRLPIRVERGAVALGLLDGETGEFIVAPVQLPSELPFVAPAHGKVRIVIANNQPGEKREASRFTIAAGRVEWTTAEKRFYTDQLLDEDAP